MNQYPTLTVHSSGIVDKRRGIPSGLVLASGNGDAVWIIPSTPLTASSNASAFLQKVSNYDLKRPPTEETDLHLLNVRDNNPLCSATIHLMVEVVTEKVRFLLRTHRSAHGESFLEENLDNPHGDVAIGPCNKDYSIGAGYKSGHV